MYEEILEQMQELLKDEIENFGSDFGKLEQAVMTMMASFGKGLLQRVVDRPGNGYEGCSLSCKCSGTMRFLGYRKRNIHTIFGWITIKRAYYRCPDCGKTLVPYDAAGGLGSEQISPALAKACCLLAVDDSFEQVSRKIEQLFGQRVCDDTVQQLVHQVGKVPLDQQNQQLDKFFADRQIPQAEANPERLYVCADGTGVREDDGWHEAKLGCIYFKDERFGEHKRYIGRLDNSETFGWNLWVEACKYGFRQAKQVVYLGDGAGWIRTEHHRHFGRATFIIDWYHALEHIWDCGKVLFGEGSKATEEWVRDRESWLWEGQTKRLLDDLREQAKKHRGPKRQALFKLHNYIRNNEQEMRYDVFRSQGYDIGSGAVEGGCKNVVGKRLKQSGMIWSRAGSSSTLGLRITWLNGGWEQLWEKKPLAA